MNYLDNIQNINLEILSSYTLEFQNIRNEYTENFRFSEPFIKSFCELLISKNKFPTQKEFRLHYIDSNIEYLKENYLIYENKKYLIESLLARLNRCYPSLIRDLHFSIFLKQNTDFNVFYNPEFDFKEGIDCLINDLYALRLFVDTKTSWDNRFKKDNRRIYSDKYIYIDVPMKLVDDKKVGMFYLYNANDIEYIKKQINI